MKKILLITLLCFSAITFAQKPIFTTAKIKSATVYSNSAELLQSASVTLPSGTSEIVIKNVADYVNENTIQIGAPANVTVLSVQFTRNFISEYEIDESNPMIKKVRDSIAIIEKEMGKIANEKVSYSKTIDLLDKNQTVAGQNSGLNVTELIKLVDYYRAKRNELSNLVDALYEKENKLKDKLSKLNSKLELNTQKQEKTSQGKLVIQVMTDAASSVNLDINYLTNNASWSPFYDLRADNINSPINLMYKAKVVQNTGIDWKKVKLTLSSGNPNQNNTAPILQAWFLRFGYPRTYGYTNDDTKMNEVVVTAYGIKKDSASQSSISNYTTINENQLNVSFDIDLPYAILSNGKKHGIEIKNLEIPANYQFYSVPKMNKDVFLMAEISDFGKYNLLPGTAQLYFDDTVVGTTQLNPNETQDSLRVCLCRDKKITVQREKVKAKSATKFLSSQKEQQFTYEITLRNNKKEAVTVDLRDQYPLSNDSSISIELTNDGKALVNTDKGFLRWNIALQPNETKKVRLSYTVRYDKNKSIGKL